MEAIAHLHQQLEFSSNELEKLVSITQHRTQILDQLTVQIESESRSECELLKKISELEGVVACEGTRVKDGEIMTQILEIDR